MFVPTEQKVITPKSITNTPTICKIFPRFGLRMVTSSCLTGWCDTGLRLVPQNWQKRGLVINGAATMRTKHAGDHSGERSTNISLHRGFRDSAIEPRDKHELAVRRALSPQMATCSIINASAVAPARASAPYRASAVAAVPAAVPADRVLPTPTSTGRAAAPAGSGPRRSPAAGAW